jgi:hypothetical protein
MSVILPGIAMVLLGILGFVMAIIWLINNQGREVPPGYEPGPYLAGRRAADVLAFVWEFIVTSGGFCMIGRRLYSVARIAAVFAMLPCHPCCVFGLAIGIWALVILNSPDGHKAFE